MLDFRRRSETSGPFTPRQQWRLWWAVMLVGVIVVLGFHGSRLAGVARLGSGASEEGGPAARAIAQRRPGPVESQASAAPGGQRIAGSFVSTAHGSAEPSLPPALGSGPREVLRAYGLDDAFWAGLRDGRPWHADEDEILLKVLYRVRGFALADIEGWSRGPPEPATLAASPADHRGEIFRLAGEVVSVSAVRPARDVAERFELPEYYACELLLADGGQPAVVFTPKVPKAWRAGGSVRQRAGAFGLFLKVGQPTPDAKPTPIFVAQRLAWHPPTLLGDLGMDMGLFDDVRQEDRAHDPDPQGKPAHPNLAALRLAAEDRECFYQLLAAVGRAEPGRLEEAARERLRRAGRQADSVEPLFLQARQQQGRLVLLAGTVRQVLPVPVHEPDIVARFGIRQYYQMALFTDDSQNNPVVFCVRDLPEGMPSGEGDQYAEYVEVAGFFFKTWGYRSREPADAPGKVRWQKAPLLIGRRPLWAPQRPPATDGLCGAIAAGLLLAAALGGVGIAWRAWRRDRAFRRQALEARFQPGPPASLNEQDIEAQRQPDFSHLEPPPSPIDQHPKPPDTP